MSLSCYLIDDEAHALEVLAEYVRQTPGLTLAGQTTNPLIGLQFLNGRHPPDITFLDVDMPELSGLTLASLAGEKTTVIFTTAYREFAAEAFEKDAADFLPKPIFYDRFLKSVQKARKLLRPVNASDGNLLVKTGTKGQLRRIAAAEIVYAESALNYIQIHLQDEKVMTYLSLQELLDQLPEGRFSRIHKSYLVSHAFIRTIEYAQLRLKDQTVLPIGRTFRRDFQKTMNEYLLVSRRDQSL